MQVFVGFAVLWLTVGGTAWFVGLWRDFETIHGPEDLLDLLALPLFMIGGPITWVSRWSVLGRSPLDFD